MDRRLALYVVVPLVGTFLVLAAFAWPFDAQDLILGAAIEIVGILVTVLYVNWVLQVHESGKWAATDALIRREIRNVAFGTVSGVIHLMELRELTFPAMTEDDVLLGEIRQFVIGKAASLAPGEIAQPLERFDKEKLMDLVERLSIEYESWSSVVDLYTHRLEPPQIQRMLKIRTLLQEMSKSIRSGVIATEVTAEALPVPESEAIPLLPPVAADEVSQKASKLFATIDELTKS